MLRTISRIAAVLLVLGATGTAMAATGIAKGVDPGAEAQGKTTRTLVVGADVFIGDKIVTDGKGLVQILFSDNTRLVVGPHSSLQIEDYLLRDNGSNGKLAINALSGTFRFITGRAAKERYVINTPTGTIGVRGTALDLFVTLLSTYVLQLHGATIDCPNDTPNDCAVLNAVCQIGILGSNEFEVIQHGDDLTGDAREQAKQQFQLIFSQNSNLLREFRVAGAERCLNRPAGGGAPGESISDPNSDTPPGNPGNKPPVYTPGFSSVIN